MTGKKQALALPALLLAAQALDWGMKYNGGGYYMDGITVAEILESAVNIGITPVLLVVFIVFFIRKANDDDARVKKAYADAQKKIEESDKTVREREDTLLAESAKREEILRQESEKRENLIRKEAEKRESILMNNQDRMLNSMDRITDSLTKIENSLSKMEARHEKDISDIKTQIHRLEDKVDHREGGAGDGYHGSI